ncbi:hypothetical protein C0992_008001 [Termitomyces sp. T32_za158]|nr:hypothetical protein C0992_008001 [Termitomyces sp. T32_za158]
MYCREDTLGWRQSTAFKKAFSIDVDIELLGVWETVGSVGMIPKRLPFTTSNTHVKHFRHALALDEHRVRFKPNFWNRPTPHEVQLGVKKGQMPRPKPKRQTTRDFEKAYSHGGEQVTDVEEVWFAGCHCGMQILWTAVISRLTDTEDVGGGAVRNEVRNSLARIPLRWMVRQCFLLKTGIIFYKEMFKVIGMNPDSVYPVVQSRPPPVTVLSTPHNAEVKYLPVIGENHLLVDISDFVSEEEEDLADALSPINDMLRNAKTWWLLEYIPQKIKYQGDDDNWVNELIENSVLRKGGTVSGGRILMRDCGVNAFLQPSDTVFSRMIYSTIRQYISKVKYYTMTTIHPIVGKYIIRSNLRQREMERYKKWRQCQKITD